MKFNALRYLMLPWFLFFCLIITAMVLDGTVIHFLPFVHDYYLWMIGTGAFVCLYMNFRTLTKAGIWIAHSLPATLRTNPWWWFLQAGIAIGIAYTVYGVGKLDWAPVIWQAAVIPFFALLCLFFAIRGVMGPILVWCSRVAFSRVSAFVLSWPIFLIVPITAIFVGRTVATAYRESRPDFVFSQDAASENNEATATAKSERPNEESIPAVHPTALELQAAVQTGTSCNDKNKLIQRTLTAQGDADTVFWAIKAVGCAEIKSIVGLPKLADIMLKHPHAVVRAEAIQQMMKFGVSNVKQIGYLLVKRISAAEPLPVIEASSLVMLKLGEDEKAWVSKRLTTLLDTPKTSALASELLVSELQREDLVTKFVSENLSANDEHRDLAVRMICSLPKKARELSEEQITNVLQAIKTGEAEDPAVKALSCLGSTGLIALQKEILTPQVTSKEVAARAFAETTWSDEKVALQTAAACVHDKTPSVRDWCSQALGKAGAPAIPDILKLLKSDDQEMKDAATRALSYLQDPEAKDALMKERAMNSGWMANKKNLELARAIDQALVNMN
ncbi:HEAT repeat domain-containing protein [Bdellovibrio sp. 22V]|uniref:HEAT repeat domain-containing protein n=1 Tax=Bdellovibrio TaxID=958 RepID=UPI002543061D|nr:HEAT repeat domain-containing protein [Bdellovibrio sp. 22V]WII71471.1 HEAT repeat domain-containing protein [Bdellovibrio sp. 22V]